MFGRSGCTNYKRSLVRQKDLNDFMKHGIVHSEFKAGMGGANNAKDSPPKDNTSPKDTTPGRDTPIAKFNITAMTIFTTVTFAAAFQVPGGYKDKTGLAILRKKKHFKTFLIFDCLAFGTSAAIMCIHFAFTIFPEIKYSHLAH